MAPTKQELSLLINPLVPEAVQHNNRVLSNLHSLTSFLLGFAAGILALQSATGFLFYLAGTVFVSFLIHALLAVYRSPSSSSSSSAVAGGVGVFFPGPAVGEIEGIESRDGKMGWIGDSSSSSAKGGVVVSRKGAWRDIWFGGGVLGEALCGFVLGWAGVGGVLR